MVEDLTDLQKEKIGKYNSIEEMQFKINNLNEEQEADPGKYEGTPPEHSVCNAFKEICLLGIEDKNHFLECNTLDYDENPCSLNYDRNLADTIIDNAIANVS